MDSASTRRVQVPWERAQPVALLVVLFVALSMGCLAAWGTRAVYPMTGDEPHYIAISRAIVDHHTLEMTKTYEEIFASGERAPPGTPLDPENSHTYPGPHGRHSVHSPGLPLLMAVPYAIGGPPAVRLGIVLLTASVVIAAWFAAGRFVTSLQHRFLATLAMTSTLPFLAAAGQVYPDLTAGIIGLTGLLWYQRIRRSTPVALDVAVTLMLAFLPWLQIKYSLPMFVIVIAATVRLVRRSAFGRALLVLLVTVGSVGALVTYNYWAFRNISGPYASDALVVGQKPAMVFLALIFDQKQGILFQGPVFWIGLLYFPRFARRLPSLAIAVVLTAGAFLLPNALHVNWFGGWGLVGRFEWAAAAVLLIPTAFGLGELVRAGQRWFVGVVGLLTALQLVLVTRLMFSGAGLEWMNTAPAETSQYPFLYGRIGRLLPALYDVPLSKGYWPNLAWFIVAALVVGWGVVLAVRPSPQP